MVQTCQACRSTQSHKNPKKKSMLKSTFTCTYLQKKVTRRLEFKQLEHKAWAEPALRLAHDCPERFTSWSKTVIKNQSVASFLQWQYCNTPAIRWFLLAKTWPPATCLAHFGPFFSVKLWTACKPSNEARGGDIHWSHAINYCSKINIFQHWRLVINQITSLKCICFIAAMSGLSSVSNSYTSPPRSLWDSFMARRLEDSQRWELPLTQSQLNKGYPCRIKVHICHLDIS